MAWTPLSRERHLDKAVGPIRDFSFARKHLLLPIVIPELRHACSSIPIVFARREGFFELFGLAGLEKDNNLYVDVDGKWINKFIPVCLQTYPCAVTKDEGGRMALLVDEDSGLVLNRNDGIPFFNEDGSDGTAINDYTVLFRSILRSRQAIRKACELIDDLGLLEPLEYKNPRISAKTIKVDGLYAINEVLFREIGEPKYLELRKTYAIDMIYAHLYSQDRFGWLLHHMDIQKKSKSVLKDLGTDIFGGAEIDQRFNFDDFS